jgi:hypothetical protein
MQLEGDAAVCVAATPSSPVLTGQPNAAVKISRDGGVAPTSCGGAPQAQVAM